MDKIDGKSGRGLDDSALPMAIRMLKGPEPDFIVKSLRVLTRALVVAIVLSLGVLGVAVKKYAKSVAEDRKALFMKASRHAKVLVAVDCLNDLSEELGTNSHGLLLEAEIPDSQHVSVVRQCVPADVIEEVARITWQDILAKDALERAVSR